MTTFSIEVWGTASNQTVCQMPEVGVYRLIGLIYGFLNKKVGVFVRPVIILNVLIRAIIIKPVRVVAMQCG